MTIGKCNCGEVVFELTSEIKDVYFCHCSICRGSTGANGIAVVVTDNENFRWVQGEESIKTWTKPNHDWQTSFCTQCGSSLPGKNDDARMYIPAGLLSNDTDTDNLKVAHHIWVDSKANWDEIAGGGIQHPEAFGSYVKPADTMKKAQY
ncbi:GFA family protein [Shewanella eurypsychrophilus]|uniref:GFA family protein n=1 Tax=Shewanella eurypsychrophilus TaxID=2593656 RepID=A0ABX6VBL4_9GAMM|nr:MULTISPECIES: GFA family protein [Shewanella]QFU24082.1 GFA family protein [Shewanella sp. YLB-09]QPG59291.1 GFA family protein [Shewanella eurypsychrophilus]